MAEESDKNPIFLTFLISNIITCGFAIILWIPIGIALLLIKLIVNKPQETTQQEKQDYSVERLPSNDDCDDWEFVLKDLRD